MPISVPAIEMIEIGAGGGSIAAVDALGQIRVGPQSAGADPGPASYDRGGTAATVTDANVHLGRLHPENFLAPDISLSPELSTSALRDCVGLPLGLDDDAAAVGVAEVVDENMANAARTHAVESGKDLAGYSMVAFGGAAPLHACRLIDKLGIDEVLVPVGAGVGSAIGFLLAPFSYEATRSFYATSENFDTAGVRAVLEELAAEAEAFVRMGTSEPVAVEREVLMRYRGQGWEIPVTLPQGDFDEIAAQELTTTFVKAYEAFFGRAIEGLTIEAVSWSVRVSSARTAPPAVEPITAGEPLRAAGTRLVHDPAAGGKVTTAVFDRRTLMAGDTLAGPALIIEDQTTTAIGSRHTAVVQPDLTLRIARSAHDAGDTASSPTASSAQHEVPMQIMWNRLISVVEEQALTLVRTAFSTSVREAGDLSAGVFDRSWPDDRSGRHRDARARQHHGCLRGPLHQRDRGREHAPRRRVPHQRPLEEHRPPPRHHRGHAGVHRRPRTGPAARAATNPGTSSASSPPPLTWSTSAAGASAPTPASCTRRASAYPSCDGPSGAGSTGTWSTSCAATSGSPTR